MFYFPRSLDTAPAQRAALHAKLKCVVVDRQRVFVSSANFTEAAQERNIEVGLLIQSGWLAERIAGHFEAMVADRLLLPVYRRRRVRPRGRHGARAEEGEEGCCDSARGPQPTARRGSCHGTTDVV